MSSELSGSTNQEDNKTMCMISSKIADSKRGTTNGKGKLILLRDETSDEKNQA